MERTKKLALAALLTALALVLSYLEALVPLSIAVPGVKLGLPNLVVIFALYRLRPRTAALISLLRVVLVSVLFGSALSLAYSAAGAVLSFLVMFCLKKSGIFGCVGVSVAGAVSHNLAQILTAALLLETGRLAWYFPVLCLSGTVAGICIGLVSALLVKRVDLKL